MPTCAVRFVDQDATEYPRLVARRTLPFKVSVLLALLRKRLAEFDASSSDVRLVLSRDQIIEILRLFMPDSTNEARLVDNIDTTVKRVCELGFLHPLRGEQDKYEVRRILKAYIDGQWLSEFDARLGRISGRSGCVGGVGVTSSLFSPIELEDPTPRPTARLPPAAT